MRLTQVRNILDQVCDFHGQLSSYYHWLSDKSAQSKVKLLLDLLSQHEQGLRDSLEAYEQDAETKVMDSWLESPNYEQIWQRVGELAPLGTDATLEKVVEVAFALDECLFDFYREGEEHAPNARIREVFRSLATLQQGEVRKLAMSATQLADA